MWSLILKIYLAYWPASYDSLQIGYFYIAWEKVTLSQSALKPDILSNKKPQHFTVSFSALNVPLAK